MKVLVDYDNVPERIRRQGSIYLADLVLSRLAPVLPEQCRSLELRLYAGWDENSRLTSRAQTLSADLRARFPKILDARTSNPSKKILISVELAQSLECLPRKPLPNTLRSVPFSKNATCQRPTVVACRNAHCPIEPVADFFNRSCCPVPGCRTTPAVLLTYLEQKLVDTMLVADLLYLSYTGEKAVALVSSDDDMWPGILMAMHSGVHVFHLQTSGVLAALPYLHRGNGDYTQLGL